jgi:PAS domain S-box-containing protein
VLKCYVDAQLNNRREQLCCAISYSEYQTRDRHTGLRRLHLIFFLFWVGLLLQSSAVVEAKEVRRVLVLSEVGPYYPAIALVDQGIQEALKQSPYEIESYREYLDTGLFPYPEARLEFLEWYKRKYRDRRPDVIITVGPSPLKLMIGASEPFFHDVPVVFCASWEEAADRPKLGPQFTGIWEEMEPLKTLEAALGLQPGTRHVFVDGGTSPYDRSLKALIRERLHNYEATLDIEYFPDLAMPELLARLRHLPDHSIVLHAGILRDAAGKQFIDATEAGPMVVRAANAPVFTLSDVNVGHGEQGGAVVSFAEDGKVAGAMALRILGGERPEDIPIVRGNTVYMFDWRAMKRWGLRERNLPLGSIVFNRPASFWELYKRYVLAGTIVLFAQSVVILALLWQRAQRRKTQTELRKSEEKFSKAFQRSPLAFTLASFVDYRLVEVNETFERYSGWRRDEVIGRTPFEIKFWVDMSQRSAFVEQLQGQGAVRGMEIAFRRKDGQVRIGLVSSELIDLNGEPCVLSLIADVTQSKHAQEALRASEERLRLAQQAGRIGTFEWNIRTGLNTWTSELEALYGLPSGGFGGTQAAFESLVYSDDRAGVIELVDRSLKTGQSTKGEWRVVWPDGSVHWIAGQWRVLMDGSGEPFRMMGVNIDITERKLAEEALSNVGRRLIQAQEQERVRIARELHDDINQRMAMLEIDLGEFSERSPDSTGNLQIRLEALRLRVSEISMEIQAIAHRLHSSKLEYLGLVAACRSFCKEVAERQRVSVEFKADKVPPGVPRDVSLTLFRVLQESLQNAIKHSSVKNFEVYLVGMPEEIRLTVRDHGVGFDVEAAMDGLGLGLVSMRERLSLVKGTIFIASRPTDGTEVNVRVPMVTVRGSKQITVVDAA